MIIGSAVNGLALVAPALAGRAAFRMFGYAGARAPLRDSEAAVQAAAVVDPITVNGKKVLTYRWGDGPRPVLLIHGWQSRASRFAAFIPRLQRPGLHADQLRRAGQRRLRRPVHQRLRLRRGDQRASSIGTGHSKRSSPTPSGPSARSWRCATGCRAGRLVTISGVADFEPLADGFIRLAGLSPRVKAALAARTASLFGPDPWQRLSGTYRPRRSTCRSWRSTTRATGSSTRARPPGSPTAYGGQARRIGTTGLGHHRILADPAVLDAALAFLTEPAPATRAA